MPMLQQIGGVLRSGGGAGAQRRTVASSRTRSRWMRSPPSSSHHRLSHREQECKVTFLPCRFTSISTRRRAEHLGQVIAVPPGLAPGPPRPVTTPEASARTPETLRRPRSWRPGCEAPGSGGHGGAELDDRRPPILHGPTDGHPEAGGMAGAQVVGRGLAHLVEVVEPHAARSVVVGEGRGRRRAAGRAGAVACRIHEGNATHPSRGRGGWSLAPACAERAPSMGP